MRVIYATAVMLGISGSGAVFAASAADPGIAILKDVSGKVLVNAGQGYSQTETIAHLKPGDAIMVSADASARLYFPKEKCSVALAHATITTVTGPEMCEQAALPSAFATPGISPANSGPPPQGEIPPLLIAGGIVLLSAAALIDGFSNNSSPVSGP